MSKTNERPKPRPSVRPPIDDPGRDFLMGRCVQQLFQLSDVCLGALADELAKLTCPSDGPMLTLVGTGTEGGDAE